MSLQFALFSHVFNPWLDKSLVRIQTIRMCSVSRVKITGMKGKEQNLIANNVKKVLKNPALNKEKLYLYNIFYN